MGCRFEPCLWSQLHKSLVDSDSSRKQMAKKAKVCSETCSQRRADGLLPHNSLKSHDYATTTP